MKNNKQKGFTLVELIVVIVILAILAAILIPSLLGFIDKSKDSDILIKARAAYTASQATASKYYGISINSSGTSDTNKDKTTDKDSYWISVTNDIGNGELKQSKFTYMKYCYDLMDAKNEDKFYMVSIVKKGIVQYTSYYDVKSKKVAYWDYETNEWTIESTKANGNGGKWIYNGNKNNRSSESFGSYWK